MMRMVGRLVAGTVVVRSGGKKWFEKRSVSHLVLTVMMEGLTWST